MKLIAALADESYRNRLASVTVWGDPPERKSQAIIEERVKDLLKKIAALQQNEFNTEDKK